MTAPSFRPAVLLTALLCSGVLVSGAVFAQDEPRAASPHGLSAPRAADAGELPENELTNDVLFQLLMAEIAHQRGNSPAAQATLLDLARRTRDPRIARRSTELALAIGQADRALEASLLWQRLAPGSAEASRTVTALSASLNRLDVVVPALKERLAQAPNKAEAVVDAARTLARANDKPAAFAALEQLLAPYAALPESHVAMVRLANEAGQPARAESEALEALRLRPDWEYAALLAWQFGSKVNQEAALLRLGAFVRANPKANDARLAYGRGLASAGKFATARAEFELMLKDSPGNPDVLYVLGLLAFQAKEPALSAGYFRQFLDERTRRGEEDRDPSVAYLHLAQIAEDDGRIDEAMGWLDRIDRGEAALNARLRKAAMLGRLKRIDEARAVLAAVEPRNEAERSRLTLAQAQLLRDGGSEAGAYELLSSALANSPNDADILYDHAMLGERLGKFPEMEASLRKAIAVRPDDAHAYNALGYSLADRNVRLEEAKALLEKAINLSPDDAFILDSMGWLQYRLGNTQPALQYLRKAYALRPDAEIAVHLGEVLWVSGDAPAAQNLWREARKKEPANETLKSTLARFNINL